MVLVDALSILFLLSGAVFFLAGTVGLLRFPDVYTRLDALTKADNVGLGLMVMVMGFILQAESWAIVGKLILIWLLVLLAGARVAYLIANRARQRRIKVWRR